jgi:CheY-like chemotaxis protein
MNAVACPPVACRPVLWIGEDHDDELSLARGWIEPLLARWQTSLTVHPTPDDACAAAAFDPITPRLAILATDRPSRWTLDDAVRLSRAWPLMPIVSVAATLVDGRRRSGPTLPGIEDVAWYDLPGRLETWLGNWGAGRAGTLTTPTATRRDERLLGIIAATSREPLPVSVVAATPMDADGVAALVPVAGGVVTAARCGRPPLDEAAAVLVWDVGSLTADALGWLGILAANRPHLAIVVVESFPRGDSVRAALEAGAAAVLGKPLSIEALMGMFHRLQPVADGLGEPRPHC